MFKFIKSYISHSLAIDKLIKSVDMSPIAPSNLPSSVDDIKYNCQVPICDILAGRKRKNDQKKDIEESSGDEEEEVSKVVKKRIVKVVSDEDEDKENSGDDSDYEVKKVHPKKKERTSEQERKTLRSDKKETLSERKPKGSSYEKMIEEKRAERIALLKSMEIDQIKEEISEAIGGIRQIKKNSVTRSYKKVDSPSSYEPVRRSKRLANIEVDFSENALEKLAVKNAVAIAVPQRKLKYGEKHKKTKYKKFQVSLADYDEPIPSEITFEAALKSASPYEECVNDLCVEEPKCNQEFISYDKAVLKNMTLNEFNVCKVVPARITSAAWYPSKEDLVVAAGDKFGNLGLWKIQDSETTPHLFKVHGGNIPNMQFNLFDPVQLITASYDGTMRCGDLIKHTFNEEGNIVNCFVSMQLKKKMAPSVPPNTKLSAMYDSCRGDCVQIYESDRHRVTWFDFLSPTTFLVSHSNGEIAVLDINTEGKTSEKRHACHDYTIKTVSVHPVNKNIFVTCDNKKTIRLWDLRKLQKNPVVEILHHKRTVNSAYFSPVTGNSILSTSLDDSICIFDSTKLTQDINLTTKMNHNNFTGRWLTIFRATWLPNSDDLFAVGSMEQPRKIEIYDKDLNRYNIRNDNLTTVTSIQRFHPYRSALAGGNSSGKLFVFT